MLKSGIRAHSDLVGSTSFRNMLFSSAHHILRDLLDVVLVRPVTKVACGENNE